MANAVTLASWEGADVRVSEVLGALESLRRGRSIPATRAAVLTLVIVAHSSERAAGAMAAVHGLGGRHPARTIAVVLDGRGSLEAEVRLVGSDVGGHAVWAEDVVLGVGGEVVDHLDSLIEPFVLSDLPCVVWCVDHLPGADSGVVRASDVVLVDAKELGDVDCFGDLVALSRLRPVVDLSWVRLRPWRRLLGGLFEGPAWAPFLGDVRGAWVQGKTGPRHLLGGWLTDRLSLAPGRLHLEAAEHVSLGVRAGEGGEFSVDRLGDSRELQASASVPGGPSTSLLVQLPPASPSWGLAEALGRLEHDPIYDRALGAALRLPPS